MTNKSINLNNFAGRAFLLAVALICILAVYFAVKWCLASTIAAHAESKETAQLAVDMTPNDPKPHYVLAALHEKTFLAEDLAKSLAEYEKATSLAPNDFRLWFDLGKARDHAGDAAGAERAFRKAVELAPNYSRVHWTLGNLLLRQGNTEEAFAEIRRATENDPIYAAPAVTTVWQFFDGDIGLISQKIGDSIPIKAALSGFLAKQQRFDEAFALWNALSAEDKKITYKTESDALLQSLLAAKKYRDALNVQSQINQPEGEKFEVGKIFNAGFETDIRTAPADAGIFEWTIADALQPQIGYDDKQKREGSRSLVIVFNSANGQDFRVVQQTVAVESGKHYNFEVFARADLKSPATVKWEIADAADGKILAATGSVPNNSDWSPLAAEFITPTATQAVTIRLARAACPVSMCPIAGKVWFDNFNLKKSE
jgi:tetratricopeptide (TPR) repeat protein